MARAEAPGPLVGAGRAADVYDIGGGRVLRRYRVPLDMQAEAAVMRHLHDAGFDDVTRACLGDVPAFEMHSARALGHEARNRMQQGTFSRTVGASNNDQRWMCVITH